jgi:hypothetical protein
VDVGMWISVEKYKFEWIYNEGFWNFVPEMDFYFYFRSFYVGLSGFITNFFQRLGPIGL